ncbi:MAG: IS4 family transposase [Oscillospiraceae bacterium]|nr:IS4 family transposase [Oscillospiraceae bacterium]
MDVNLLVNECVRGLKTKINDFFFKKKHRVREQDFTRKRKLAFVTIIYMMLNFNSKSNELTAYNFFEDILEEESVTGTAFENARSKIKSSAFVELFVDTRNLSISAKNQETFYGYRICAIDGSTALLPYSVELLEKYGSSTPVAGKTYARISICADVLNGVVLDGEIDSFSVGERKLAMRHIQKELSIKAIYLFDRGYWDPKLIVAMFARGQKFLMRLSKNAIKEITDSKENSGDYILVNKRSKYRFRYYKFQLDSGEIEYLITNVSRDEISDSDLPNLYRMRWGVETKYNELKNRLRFEDFSGKSVNAIEQEFYASMIVMNMTGFVIAGATVKVKEKKRSKRAVHAHKPNGNMAVGILKNRLIKAIITDDPVLQEKKIDKLVNDISKYVIPIKPNRKNQRTKTNTKHRRTRRPKNPL